MTLIMTPEVMKNLSKARKLETYFPVSKNEEVMQAYHALYQEFGVEVWAYPAAKTFAFNADIETIDLRGNYPTWYDAMIAGIKYLKIEYKGELKEHE